MMVMYEVSVFFSYVINRIFEVCYLTTLSVAKIV